MSGKNDAGFGKTTAAQTLRKRAEEILAAGDKPLKDMSASEMSTLIHELHIHQVELEMQNEELRKSQAETERSRRAYQDLWELSPVGYLIVDAAGRVADVNRAGQRLFGRPENALLNERFTTLVFPENQVPVHLMFERTVETGIAERQEVRIKKPGGASHICLLEVRSFGGEPGREQIQAVLTDIAKQRRAEDDLRKTEQEKKAILDSLVEHVVYSDREMKILWANKAACESVGMKREDLLESMCHEVWADRRTPCEDCPVIKARDTGQPQMVEKMTPDGRWWHIKGHPVRDKNGHVTGMTELALDITERKQAEEAVRNAKDNLEIKVAERTAELIAANEKLKQEIKVRNKAEKKLQASEKLLSTTFDALQDLMVVIDKDFRVVMSNWKDHEYISEKDRQGHPFCYEVFMNRNKPCDFCHAMEVFTTGEAKQLEATNSIDGKVRDIRMLPMFDDKGEVVAVFEHLRDITEHIQAEHALQDSENRLRELFNNMRNGVAVYQAVDDGKDFIFVDFNNAGERLDNIKKEDLIGKRLLEMYPGVKEFGLFDVLQWVWSTGKPKDNPISFYQDGRISAWRENYVYRLPSGEVVAVFEDITERIQAQEGLRKSEARYRALSEATFEAIFISENGICLDTNQRAIEAFGYGYEELIGIFGTDIIAAESKELVKRNMLSGYEKPYEAIAQKKDGTKFHVEIRGKMMKYEEKNVRMTVIRDINEQKIAEEALRESEKRYRNLFNSIPIGLYRTTAEGSILDVNPAMLEILGYSDQDALLQTASPDIYVDPNDRMQLQRLMEEKGFVHDFTVQMRRPDGRPIWVSINATIDHDSNNQKTYYKGAMADISDRKDSEERIYELSHQLMQAQEDERQMISRELHDRVAQDLSTLLIGLDTLFDHQPNVILEIRNKALELAEILQGTIGAVRDLSYDLRLPGLEGMGLIPALSMYCEEFEEKWGLKIDFQSTGMGALNLDFDTEMTLYRLIQEGLNNIRKHAAANQASVKLVGTYPNIILRIEDDGKGFDLEKRARTADSEKRMGLRSMAERVHLIQGKMQIHSQPMKGTRIFIKFPYQEKKHGSK